MKDFCNCSFQLNISVCQLVCPQFFAQRQEITRLTRGVSLRLSRLVCFLTKNRLLLQWGDDDDLDMEQLMEAERGLNCAGQTDEDERRGAADQSSDRRGSISRDNHGANHNQFTHPGTSNSRNKHVTPAVDKPAETLRTPVTDTSNGRQSFSGSKAVISGRSSTNTQDAAVSSHNKTEAIVSQPSRRVSLGHKDRGATTQRRLETFFTATPAAEATPEPSGGSPAKQAKLEGDTARPDSGSSIGESVSQFCR